MKYVLSLSFGKDSMAMLIEVLKRRLPLDYVIFCDIKFNSEISGEHPLMSQWIPKAEQILKDKFGVEVIHLTANFTYCDVFYRKKTRGEHIGQIYGFPYLSPYCNSELKVNPIKKFVKSIVTKYGAITEYIGIAKDEPKRLQRYKELQTDKHKYITLADLGIDELMAMEICKEHDLLSPKYTNSFRGGCWFCPKQSMSDLYELWQNYPTYFEMLAKMEKDSFNTFKPNKTIAQIKQEFENGKIPKKKVRHKQVSLFD